MGRGTGLAKLALGMGALRAISTAAHAAAWSSYPRYPAYPYSHYSYYEPYYYYYGDGGYYGYGYGSSRGAAWFIAAVCVAIIGACCLLIPGVAGIVCCGVGIAASLGLTITGVVKAHSAPDTVVVKEQSTRKQVDGNSQSQGQSQNKGNCAEKPRVVAPKENQMGIVRNGKNFEIKSNKKPEQMAKIKTKPELPYSINFMKNNNKVNNSKHSIYNTNAKFNQSNLDKQLGSVKTSY